MLKLSPRYTALMGIWFLVLWFWSGTNLARPLTLLLGIGVIAFSIYLQRRRDRPVTVSLAVPLALLGVLVVLLIVFQVATGKFMLSSWLFIGFYSAICYAAYLRSKDRSRPMSTRLLLITAVVVLGGLFLYGVQAGSLRPNGVGFDRLYLLAFGLLVPALLNFMIASKYPGQYRVLSLCFAIPMFVYSSLWLSFGGLLFAVVFPRIWAH